MDLTDSVTHKITLDEVNRGLEMMDKKIGDPIRIVMQPKASKMKEWRHTSLAIAKCLTMDEMGKYLFPDHSDPCRIRLGGYSDVRCAGLLISCNEFYNIIGSGTEVHHLS